ncbi:MAG TPA: DNA mismatch repair endonuclease MutL [Candidatus Krumholzibacteriaceae bacterium]|nr:DNA mismatch repair endonuclease MutL [Candidatus Krumholzibacteriaceae bacterium]
MASIKTLSEETAGKIAAGEIIERPKNIVKELVENSLDAGATKISITVKNGGKSYIRVEDNGIGIPQGEIALATDNYSTSKISSFNDIDNIKTLGFRGEALASIKSVSRLTIVSKSGSDDVGTKMVWEGNKPLEKSPVPRKEGTTVTSEQLFFNLPARMKFLSSDSAELRQITALVQKFSISFPQIGFIMNGNGREIFSYNPAELKDRIEDVFGSAIFRDLKYFDSESGRLRLFGYTSSAELTRGNRTLQHFFVNHRYVSSKVMGYALKRAYESVIPYNRFPVAVLFLEIPPDMIDVNVHPTKSEVRFKNDREIHSLVFSSIRNIVKGEKAISFQNKVESVYRSIFPAENESKNIRETGREQSSSVTNIDYYKASKSESDMNGGVLRESPESLFEKGKDKTPFESTKLYWQLHDSYILIQIRGGMVIIDQHAAHERILYNQAKKNLAGETPAIQSLLFPATIELTPGEYKKFEDYWEILPRIGFEVEPFGMRTIVVRGIPAGVKNWNEGLLLRDILGEIGRDKTEFEEMLKRFACHSAIRFGHKLTRDEMENLVDQLFATDFPFTCPHGRPTILRVNLSDLEKRFNRSV